MVQPGIGRHCRSDCGGLAPAQADASSKLALIKAKPHQSQAPSKPSLIEAKPDRRQVSSRLGLGESRAVPKCDGNRYHLTGILRFGTRMERTAPESAVKLRTPVFTARCRH